MASVSAESTDQTPVTAAGDTPPHSGFAKKLRSRRGNTTSDSTRLTRMTTAMGAAAFQNGGGVLAASPWASSAVSNSCEAVARSRKLSSAKTALVDFCSHSSPKLSPRARAAASCRASHHRPKPSMMAEASIPRPGAAKGVVPKKGMGMVFWIDGVPGMADMVKVDVPSMIAAGISRRGMPAARNIPCAMGAMTKKATNRLTPP